MTRYFVLAFASATLVFAQSTDTVPAELLALANRTPLEFANMLATACVPSGIELREIDDVYTSGRPEVTPDTHFDLETRIPANRVADAFNENHREYRADWMEGVMVIRPREGQVAFLDEPSELTETFEIVGVMNAARRILCQLQSSLCSGVVLGSQIGSLETAGFHDHIRLDPANRPRVIDMLNQIVRQSPRTWNVVTRSQINLSQVLSYGFIHAHGQRTIQQIAGFK